MRQIQVQIKSVRFVRRICHQDILCTQREWDRSVGMWFLFHPRCITILPFLISCFLFQSFVSCMYKLSVQILRSGFFWVPHPVLDLVNRARLHNLFLQVHWKSEVFILYMNWCQRQKILPNFYIRNEKICLYLFTLHK